MWRKVHYVLWLFSSCTYVAIGCEQKEFVGQWSYVIWGGEYSCILDSILGNQSGFYALRLHELIDQCFCHMQKVSDILY